MRKLLFVFLICAVGATPLFAGKERQHIFTGRHHWCLLRIIIFSLNNKLRKTFPEH